jgi:cellulose synthase/poly-beta-1,6-N-acetylglucosamine synthase-like glycosyltransferase
VDVSSSSGAGGRIAVIIPCFNDGATIDEAVASARLQDMPVELVVVDDGSDDPSTLAALERLGADGVRVLRQANAGPSPARMAGVHATDAPYVLPLDADDILATGALRVLHDALAAEPRAAAAWGRVRHFGAVSFVQGSAAGIDPWQITYHNYLPLSSLYRREAVLAAGGWEYPGGYEDWDLWMGLAERGWTGVGVPVVTCHYRVAEGRRLSRSLLRHEEIYAALSERHAPLFADRERNRRRSPAPPVLKVALPLIYTLPVSASRRRLLGSALAHVALQREWGAVRGRAQAYHVRTGGSA